MNSTEQSLLHANSEKSAVEKEPEAFRKALAIILKERSFSYPSFDIYKGVTGLLDYGPSGRLVELNVLSLWRKYFVNEEDMLEVGCTALTPEIVFNASGHVKKFTDLMVKDVINGKNHRADHLVKGYCERLKKDVTISAEKAAELDNLLSVVENLSAEELGAKIQEYGITAPDTNNPLSHPPRPFNLMFQTSIGSSGSTNGYLRPETAQGIFVNFNEYYKDSGEKLPFAVAQVGRVFRNEISPRQGPIRAREFLLAEIEHFVDPENKSHPKFPDVESLEFLMFPREEQEKSGQSAKKLCLGEAVAKGTVNSETLGYFIGRVYLFLVCLGIDKERLRFRQHKANEMAHYAADCWDAEIECSYGWIECVGIADRSAYDLLAHSRISKVALKAEAKLAEPIQVEELVITPVMREMGLAFKGDQKNVVEALQALNEEEAMKMKGTLESKGEVEFEVCTLGKKVTINKDMVSILKKRTLVSTRVFTPSVVEPSFGIGRIMYCMYEHCISTRPSKAGDQQLNVFRFPPLVAPIKCTVFPLVQNQQFEEATKLISKQLKSDGIKHKIDVSGKSIGKKYARADELGVPFAITVDSETSVTIRERDSRDQVRVSLKEAASVVTSMAEGKKTWQDVCARLNG
ncbi:hypothetical protein CARUB_v10004365mg [Capsella rubella]|uniref:glycine--tRNA ligase n=1 Tax=Capsella rubella TaxID=81985 RepID=R0GYI3_9BRAS|nr:glycine--tRNA ligase, mitochondrial 1 [Capsella rubella]EOA16223.1 hypothetical protein CARUB_v10004365mg [Capsella rubella]